eukprot:1999870-Pleurochrysis_carterae.AAC.2
MPSGLHLKDASFGGRMPRIQRLECALCLSGRASACARVIRVAAAPLACPCASSLRASAQVRFL